MTNTFLTFLLTGMMTLNAFGQTDKEEITQTFKAYFQTVEQRDNSRTLDYIYPKIFDHFPKDRMLQAMEDMKADTTSMITIENDSITNISETLEIDGIKYALIKYTFKMIMVNKEKPETDGEGEFNAAETTYELLAGLYGEKNVTFDRENNRLDIITSNEMYAIHDPAYKDWKFLEKKENMKPILEKLLPKKVLKSL